MLGMIIPVLEVVTLVLIGFLAFRLFQVYSAFQIESRASAQVPVLTERNHSDDSEAITVEAKSSFEVNDQLNTASAVKPSLDNARLETQMSVEASEKVSEDALSDYIGEFFADTKKPDLSEFRASPALSTANEAQEQAASETSDGVKLENEPVTRVSSNAEVEVVPPAEEVMSDRVVRAMLNEAKLVCAS